jgi:hypothetical protein
MPPLTRRDFLRLTGLGTVALTTPLVTDGLLRASASAAITITPSPSLMPPAAKSMAGLFVLMPPNETAIPPELLNSPLLTGITLQISWSQLQPAPNVVAWDMVEGALARVKAANKVLALRPLAGTSSPAWLYDPAVGVRRYRFTPESDLYHPLEFGQDVAMPLPWDEALLREWGKFISVLGGRFDGEPNFIRVAVAGPTYQLAEMYLPRIGTVVDDWSKMGYSLTNMKDAWLSTLETYSRAFAKTPFTLDLNPMPDPTDKSGSTLNALVPIAVAQYGIQRFPGRFFPATSDLSDVYPYVPGLPGPSAPPALYRSYEQQAAKIYDYLDTAPIGLTVSSSKMSREEDRVKVVFDRAKVLKARYVEVPVDWVLEPANESTIKSWLAGPPKPTGTLPPTSTPRKRVTPTPTAVG